MTNFEKGALLEDAVRRIETVIIQSSPAYSEANFEIESRKIVTVAGVRHEIDLWVMAKVAKGYEAVFIFECRNRQQKVSKNDIIVFSEKVKATSAAKGFFVAKEFTEDAVAQLALDPRLTPLVMEEILPESVTGGEIMNRTNFEDDFWFGLTLRNRAPLTEIPGESTIEIAGEKQPLLRFVDRWYGICRDLVRGASFKEGSWPFTMEVEQPFEAETAFLNGIELKSMGFYLEGVAIVERPVVVSAFNVQTRGRTLRLDYPRTMLLPEGVLVSVTDLSVTITDP